MGDHYLRANDLEQISHENGFSLVSAPTQLAWHSDKGRGISSRVRRCRWRCSSLANEREQYSQDKDFRWEAEDFFLDLGVDLSSSMVYIDGWTEGNWRKSGGEEEKERGKYALWGITCR